jgi:hypothetical protein
MSGGGCAGAYRGRTASGRMSGVLRSIILFSCVIALDATAYSQTTPGDRWLACLKSSFHIDPKKKADRNAAAEMAFQACATEEEEFQAESDEAGMPHSSFAHLKATIKQSLVEGK